MAALGLNQNSINSPIQIGNAGAGVATTFDLNAGYTYGSAGNVIAWRFNPTYTGTINAVYYYLTAKTGTPGDIKCEIRNFNTLTSAKPGTTLLGSQTHTPSGTQPGWQKITFSTPVNITKDTPIWIVMVPSGTSDASNFWRILSMGTLYNVVSSYFTRGINTFTTANGFSTDGTQTGGSGVPNFVVEITPTGGSALNWGCGYTSYAGPNGSNTNPRGIKISGLQCPMLLEGICATALTRLGNWKVFKGTNPNPSSDTPLGTIPVNTDFIAQNAWSRGVFSNAPITLYPGETYRIVWVPTSANDDQPYCHRIENLNGNSAIQDTRCFGGRICNTRYSSGVWTDEPDNLPNVALIFSDILSGPIGQKPVMGY